MTTKRQQAAEARAVARELAELATMPHVRVLDRLPPPPTVRYIPPERAALPWPTRGRR